MLFLDDLTTAVATVTFIVGLYVLIQEIRNPPPPRF